MKLVFILLLFAGLAAKAQTWSITGTVSDEKGETVPGATVYLANTKNATATDGSGKFSLNNLQPGVYALVAKMLGFKAYNQSITVQKKSPDLHIVLKTNSVMLNMVNITAVSDEDRKKYMALFKQYFIGESDNAAKCKILNPEVINFSYNKISKVLEASSDKFLLMENKSLGYELHYLITAFKLDLQFNTLYNDGSLYFEDLQGTKSQQEKWESKRKLTYKGSMEHFFKAAFNNTLTDEGFVVYRFPDKSVLLRASEDKKGEIARKYFIPLNDLDSFFTVVNESAKSFNLQTLKKDSTELYVNYTKGTEPVKYTNSRRKIFPPFIRKGFDGQISIIHPVLDNVDVDKNGNIDPPGSIFRSGYWTWGKAADFLPFDYAIPAIKKE